MNVIILIIAFCFTGWTLLSNINSVILLRSKFFDKTLQEFDMKHKELKKKRLQQQYFYISCKIAAMIFVAYLMYRLG